MTAETDDGAVRAFEALRAEVAAMRKELPKHAPADYSLSLAEILGVLKVIGGLLNKMEKHPALAMTPERHEQLIREAGRIAMSDAVERINEIARRGTLAREQLEGIVGHSRARRAQLKWLAATAGVSLMVGLIWAPFAARGLPEGLQSQVAALVMEKDRWEVGQALMAIERPEDWRGFVWATEFVKANMDSITACREVAVKTGKPARCATFISAPEDDQ